MEEPKKKRKVFLLGAGAAMPWGGPSTTRVTDLILGRIENENSDHANSRFTNLIYNFLVYKSNLSEKKNEINFEDIISAVEELILYFHNPIENEGKRIGSNFFDLKPDFEKDLKVCFTNGKGVYENLLKSLNNILRSIRIFVHKYSLHYSSENSKILPCDQHFDLCRKNERTYLINLFNKWASKIGLDYSYIRSYTLNYDKLYSVLFENYLREIGRDSNSQVFEGFTGTTSDVNQIFFNRDQHCHYNLHGSTYWHLLNHKGSYGLKEYVFELGEFPYLEITDEESSAQIQIEVGRPYVLSNIIAGYKKAQRSFKTPFKQMHASFEMDILQADEIYIIGYSFSDAHINAGLTSALNENKNLKINIISPSFDSIEFRKLVKDIFPGLFDIEKLLNGRVQNSSVLQQYLDGKLNVYPLTFEEYLKHINNIK